MKGCSVLITKNEFAVLAALEREPGTSQRAIAARKAMSLGSVNAAYKALVDKGLVVDGALSDAGFEALAPFKVDNAIILAAGLSSRFAPISYEKPKGLLHVRGEILIERQIRQLQESGIDDITVVAGYKKEYFFYLEEKHGVSIVVNEEYATRNNHSSLMVVRERLGNTFICSSDNYFVENPFEPYVWKAYYAVSGIFQVFPACPIPRGPYERMVHAFGFGQPHRFGRYRWQRLSYHARPCLLR